MMQQTVDLHNNLDLIVTRVDQLETRVSSLDDAEINNQKRAEIITRVDELTEQMDYLENKSRQNNVCIYNVAEKSEGTDMTAFLKKLLREALGVSEELHIVRAHRTSKERQDSARPIIFALLDSDMKRRVLHAAWRKKEVTFMDARIFFDHDFTFKVRQQILLYKDVREQLKAQDIKGIFRCKFNPWSKSL